ncbi:protein-glucosylgalactosylhydroxylysine glucosidase [Protopterus annectens]|uniref:protein-glucosylgalactosylhydroxylysine glucosidase n=1 Tax=Protopterus annectens TaxID=7888 RepID=UPI001CFB0319|nr:protein-glucosylgalactosylhydroxylysine glucosidase [Protopterus annectens]
MSNISDDPAVFTTDTLPSDPRFMATVANGYLGTKIYDKILHVNGVYNGGVGDCHRADVPSPVNVRLNIHSEKELKQRFTLNTRTGTFTHTLSSDDYLVTQYIFAHRSLVNLLAIEVLIERLVSTDEPITVQLQSSFRPASQDLDLKVGPEFQGGMYIFGKTLVPEVKGAPQPIIHMIWTPVPETVTLPAGEQKKSWMLLTALAESEEDVKVRYSEGMSKIESGQLRSSHEDAWAKFWQGSYIKVKGPAQLSQAVHGCMYYLLSSLPPLQSEDFLFNGISPGGLANGKRGEDYWGHVFWDQDTWMYPNVLLFYPEIGRDILNYRIRTLNGATQNAQKQGYKGAKFPWESAVTGEEVCPEDIYGDQEIHINGDISFAFQQYFYLSQDLMFFSEKGAWDVVKAIAEYWSSRTSWNVSSQNYDIIGVMPPDEYQEGVNNSVYTNVVAKYSLQFAVDLAYQLQIEAPKEWQEIADNICVPFDQVKQYHPEFDGYQQGTNVKQADVVLLGFPLSFPMSSAVRENDLEIYERVTDPHGPAMTWSMFAVGWLELKRIQKAEAQLKKCYSNIQEPFKVWTESQDGKGAVNFLTGMGGFLQAVLFGYTGFRITKSSLNFDPLLTDDLNELRISGICYIGNKLEFIFTKDTITVTLTTIWSSQYSVLEVALKDSGQHFLLQKGQPVSFPFGAGQIQKRATCWPL